MTFRIGTKDDENKMMSSQAQEGSFLFRKSEKVPDSLTLCVKKTDGTCKKYQIDEVKGDITTYKMLNKTMTGKHGGVEKFPTLDKLVRRKQKVFNLFKDFLDSQKVQQWPTENTYDDEVDGLSDLEVSICYF